MINLKFSIDNPWSEDLFDLIYSRGGPFISKYKFWEFEFYRSNRYLFLFGLNTAWGGHDHAGPSLEIGLFGFEVTLSVLDSRHWDFVTNTWERYEYTPEEI